MKPPPPRTSTSPGRRFAKFCLRWAFFLGSLLFLVHFAHEITRGPGFHNLTGSSFVGTGLAAIIISLASLTSAIGWNLVLAGLSGHATLKQSAAVYCSTQIAKYLPGNIGHYVGRVALAKRRLGISTPSAILSLLQETALACLSALVVGLFCYFFFPERALYGLTRAGLCTVFALVVVTYFFLTIAADALRKNADLHSPILQKAIRTIPRLETSSRALPFYIAGYICIGIAASVVAAGIMKIQPEDVVFITGAYSLAWIVGFLIPGAPGGLGVRESALVVLLAGAYPKDAVLMLALLARLASVGADLLTFVAGMLLMRNLVHSKKLSAKNGP